MKLYIKHMVSNRCKLAVNEVLEKLGIHYSTVHLGEVNVLVNISPEQREKLRINLSNIGLLLTNDDKAILIEKIKNIIINSIHHIEEPVKINFSHYLSKKINHSYAYLASLFSELEETTIEQFLISHKVEKVKELLTYGELNITEISGKLNYSSIAHLSNQFKKVVGLSPSQFLKLKNTKRKPLEEIGKSTKEHLRQIPSKTLHKHKIKLFLVDNDPIYLKFLEAQFLKLEYFIVQTFETGELCIENLVHGPDIIISDYYLNSVVKKAFTGLETLDKIKSLNAAIPVIILSSQNEIEVAVNCLRHKATDYVVKNKTAFLSLQKIIGHILNNRKTEKSIELV
jgi:YesN/AraC family two-component response regulator